MDKSNVARFYGPLCIIRLHILSFLSSMILGLFACVRFSSRLDSHLSQGLLDYLVKVI